MTDRDVGAKYVEYEHLVVHLKQVIEASMARVLQDPPDLLFLNNLNFFTKAYLVSLCTCLEAFLQDVAFAHVNLIQERLSLARIPNNFVRWTVSREIKKDDLRFVDFALSMTRKELADELSGNPGKTIVLFRYLGLDLQANENFKKYKDIVGAVVVKRNNIIHHNDSAADVSMADLLTYADQFLLYMQSIRDSVSNVSPPASTGSDFGGITGGQQPGI